MRQRIPVENIPFSLDSLDFACSLIPMSIIPSTHHPRNSPKSRLRECHTLPCRDQRSSSSNYKLRWSKIKLFPLFHQQQRLKYRRWRFHRRCCTWRSLLRECQLRLRSTVKIVFFYVKLFWKTIITTTITSKVLTAISSWYGWAIFLFISPKNPSTSSRASGCVGRMRSENEKIETRGEKSFYFFSAGTSIHLNTSLRFVNR